ncbi:sAF domain protein [Clostridium sp. CAG:793]|jgi:hypothetical protein|nr:sAF domain protein [Clostridium sp. CAG:793]
MATMNPLEKKARSSFIKGLLIAGLIGIIVIVILTVQIFKMRGEENQRIASQKNVVIIKQDIKSGEEITSDMLLTVKANSEVASTGAMTMADFSTLSTATDDAGNTANLRVLAKIDISAKTVITEDMLSTEETAVSNDLRQQEYNMIVLPSTLADGDTIDIRLRLPNGADYIVLSKKKVKLADLNGAVSATTILINVTEDQILTMSAAIVDAYKISGSKLYATKYTDPGLQAVATATYIPSNDTINLIDKDPNIVTTARNALITRYNENYSTYRTGIQSTINSIESSTQQSRVESGTSSETATQQAERKTYLDSLAGE